jgi:NitT/TauT family transport system substrate-binding protein
MTSTTTRPRRARATALVAFFALLAGCSSTGSADPFTSAPPAPAEAAATSEAPASAAAPAGPETVRLGVMVDSPAAYAAAYGNAEGTFEKYGVTVDVSTFSMGIETLDAIALGQKDIGGGADFAVVNRFGAGADNQLRAFAVESTSKTNSGQLWTVAGAVQSIADLKGKNVVTQLGTVVEYWLAVALAGAGLGEGDVNLAPVDSPMAAVALLQNGSADAAILNQVAAQTAQEIDGARVLADLNGLVSPTLSLAISTESYLTQHATAVTNYLKAQGEIFALFESDPEGSAKVLAKALNAPEETLLINLQNTNFWLDLTNEEIDTMRDIYDWAIGQDKIPYPYTMDDFIDPAPLTAAAPAKVTYGR